MDSTPGTPPPPDRIDEIINWTLPGLAFYYRDSNLSQAVLRQYRKGLIFRSPTFVDVSNFAGKPVSNCRFIIASSKAAPPYQINPATEKWGLHTLNCNSIFKVVDVFELGDFIQLLLLHIPYKGIAFFRNATIDLGGRSLEDALIARALASLQEKEEMEIPTALQEQEWIDRTQFPIGLDQHLDFFSLEPTEPLPTMAVPLYAAIRKLTQDVTDLNEAPLPPPG